MPKQRLPDKVFVWNSELAYVVGLLVTDGSLSKDGRHIVMRSNDIQLLETFKKCIKISNKILKTVRKNRIKPCYMLEFGNVQLYRWLVSIGLMPAKTHKIGSIKIDEKFFIDFLRGHLDGDGSIFTYKDEYNCYKGKRYTNLRIYTTFISVSESHIKWLHSMIKKHTNLTGALLRKKMPTGTTMWTIKFAKYNTLKLLTLLYYKDDLPCLERKRMKATMILASDLGKSS